MRGDLLVRRAEPVRLCASLTPGRPPGCGRPSLVVIGLGNPYRALEGLEQVAAPSGEPLAGWARGLTLSGFVEESRLRLALSRPSERVAEHFRGETGQRLIRDWFLANAEIDHLSFQAARDPRVVRRRVREWGKFDILVVLQNQENPLGQVINQLQPYVEGGTTTPDARGVTWLRLRRVGWTALTEYRQGFVLQWISGESRRTDERWLRLDRILRTLR